MNDQNLLNIQEASDLSGKSLQTIRRAIKQKKIEAKRKKTAQGFQYFISRESVISFYKIKAATVEREAGGIKKPSQELSTNNFVTVDDFQQLKDAFEHLLKQKGREKEQLHDLLKALQDKYIAMENQLKMLQEPAGKRHWYQFWRG